MSGGSPTMTLKRNFSAVVEETETSSLRRSTRAKKAKLVVGTSEEMENAFQAVASEVIEAEIHESKALKTTASKTKTRAKGKQKAKSNEDEDDVDYETLRIRVSSPWKVGAHVSAAGGVENSVNNAARIGANAFALFVKSQRKWQSPPTKPESVTAFKKRMKALGYEAKHVLPHGSYLINLGNPDEEKREKSYECFLDDLRRCDELGLELYNFHPGSTCGQVEPSVSIQHIANSINRAHKDTAGSRVVIILENMAGSGNVIGSDFAELGQIIEQVEDKTRVGVCLDTCHMFAAGYDIQTKEGWEKTMDIFHNEVGLKYLRGMHLNDSQTQCGSRRDRHENIGIGHLTISAFTHILADPRTQDIPMILETPCYEDSKGLNDKWEVWKKEIEVLNRLGGGKSVGAKEERHSDAGVESVDGEDSKGGQPLIEGTIEAWVEEVREVVGRASGGKDKPKAKTKGLGKKAEKKKSKEESDDSDE